jgi:hypothetical protein
MVATNERAAAADQGVRSPERVGSVAWDELVGNRGAEDAAALT